MLHKNTNYKNKENKKVRDPKKSNLWPGSSNVTSQTINYTTAILLFFHQLQFYFNKSEPHLLPHISHLEVPYLDPILSFLVRINA